MDLSKTRSVIVWHKGTTPIYICLNTYFGFIIQIGLIIENGEGTTMGEDELKIYLRLQGEVRDIFSLIKKDLGIKNNTEVLRSLINYYYKQNKTRIPLLEYFNLTQEGVTILDRNLKRTVQIHFKPEIRCEHCKTSGCSHIRFALGQPEIQEVIKGV